jgi:hypothetical protein
LPVGRKGRAKSLVVFKGLARAVRRESGVAVAHHWSVDKQTVWKWRKALGVGRVTEGTSKRLSTHARGRQSFGRAAVTVWKWRKALGVGRVTEGTSKRLSGRARRRRPLAASILSAHSVLW